MAALSTTSQAIAHPINCFSGSPDFVDAIPWRIFSSPFNSQIKNFEFANGLYPREMSTMHDSSSQLILVQPSMINGLTYRGLSFRPSDSTLEALLELYKHNIACPSSERKRFDDEISLADTYEYTPIVTGIKCPIYTRHPLTGVVTKHDSPHTHLPRISTTIRPAFAVHHAYGALLLMSRTVEPESLLRRVGKASRSAPPEFLSLYQNAKPSKSPPVTCPELTTGSSSQCSSEPSSSSKKRKRETGDKSSTVIPEWLGGIQAFEDLPPDDLLEYTAEESKGVDEALQDEAAWLSVGDDGQRKRQRC